MHGKNGLDLSERRRGNRYKNPRLIFSEECIIVPAPSLQFDLCSQHAPVMPGKEATFGKSDCDSSFAQVVGGMEQPIPAESEKSFLQSSFGCKVERRGVARDDRVDDFQVF